MRKLIKGGKYRIIEPIGQDMLEIRYPNGFTIDVGYIEDTETYYVTIIKNNDWVNIHDEIPAKTENELIIAINNAIDFVTHS